MNASPIELVCPAGGLPALKAAVDNGANCVYAGFKDDTNARNFNGLNFDETGLKEGIRYAHDRGVKVLIALNTFPQCGNWNRWTAAVDRAADLGVNWAAWSKDSSTNFPVGGFVSPVGSASNNAVSIVDLAKIASSPATATSVPLGTTLGIGRIA